MKILTGPEIQRAIQKCQPNKIAVAYVGADWRSFIPDTKRLDAVLVSPTIGTNPHAVAEMARAIGWDKVLFLDELHAKVYLGDRAAVVGSANLTRNGLGVDGLIEVSVEVRSPGELDRLNGIYQRLVQRGKEAYPTKEDKLARLKELSTCWNAAVSNRIVARRKAQTPTFVDFTHLGKDQFYVVWYQDGDCEYSEEVKAIEHQIKEELHFHHGDDVRKETWALTWLATASGRPHMTSKPSWLYIHEVFDDGIADGDEDYTKCAIERADKEKPHPPFELTKEVIGALKEALTYKRTKYYLVQWDRPIFSLEHSLDGIPLLIKQMRHLLTKAH